MPGISGLGDEAFDALRRILARIDAGANLEDVVYGDESVKRAQDLRDMLFSKPTQSWMDPEEEAAFLAARERQRTFAAQEAARREQEALAARLAEVESDEMFLQWLRSQGFDV